jgi:glycosyltransferase involved in cell wall biosynthesis
VRNLNIIHCNNRDEVRSVVQAAAIANCAAIFNHHVPARFDPALLSGLHGFVAPNREVVRYMVDASAGLKGSDLKVRLIPPMYDAERCLQFESSLSRRKWFAQQFNVSLNDAPLICSIGNMVSDLEHKNYPLLLRAIAELIHKRRIVVQAVLAGDGPARPYFEQLATDLRLREHVHFLGFAGENTPGVLHHSDFFVLASSREAFGIVFLEAGLMKRPAVGATGTGAEQIIIDGETGFLFKNSDEQSLADRIACLALNRSLSSDLGNNGFKHVQRHFSPNVILQEYLDFYTSARICAPRFPTSPV